MLDNYVGERPRPAEETARLQIDEEPVEREERLLFILGKAEALELDG